MDMEDMKNENEMLKDALSFFVDAVNSIKHNSAILALAVHRAEQALNGVNMWPQGNGYGQSEIGGKPKVYLVK